MSALQMLDQAIARRSALKAFQTIPGVGPRIAEDLWNLGYHAFEDLRGADPELMYAALCKQHKMVVDRCMLYVFRCAVYFVSNETHDPARLKWWSWRDKGA